MEPDGHQESPARLPNKTTGSGSRSPKARSHSSDAWIGKKSTATFHDRRAAQQKQKKDSCRAEPRQNPGLNNKRLERTAEKRGRSAAGRWAVTNIVAQRCGDKDMPVTYKNRKGLMYYLCQNTTKAGKLRYYFTRESHGTLCGQVPEGYQIQESVNGVVSLSKVRPTMVRACRSIPQ